MSQTTTCLCILSFITLVGCAEEEANIFPDGGPRDAGRDAGAAPNPTGRVDGGIDAGRDAARPSDGDDEEEDQGDDEETDGPDAGGSSFELTSPDVTAGELLPAEHRCDDAISPALSWTPGPEGTLSYAVQMRDTAARATIKSFWVLFDIPAEVTEIPRELPRDERVELPVGGARQALDDSRGGDYGYYGPCTDTAVALTVHALDVAELPDITESSTATEVNAAIAEHELSKATIEARADADQR